MTTHKLFVGLLIVLIFGLGFFIGRLTAPEGTFGIKDKNNEDTAVTKTDSKDVAGQAKVPVSGGTTINTSNLTDGQLKLLNAFGINPDEITITPAMITCAESKLGTARVEEIKNGATPTFTEGISLVVCYQ